MPGSDDSAQILETDVPDPPHSDAMPTQYPRRTITVVFIAALLLLMAMAALDYIGAAQSAEHERWVDHTYEVILAADKLLLDQQDTAAGERGYLLTGKQVFMDQYLGGRGRVGPDIDALMQLTRDNPVQQERLARIRPLAEQRLQRLDRLNSEPRPQGRLLTESQMGEVVATKQTMEGLRAITGDMVGEEYRLLEVRRADTEQSQHWLRLVMVTGDLLSLGIMAICLLLLNREIRSRRAAESDVQALNEELKGRAALLELSNKELEGFSYSISHDLRAPLRAIDGFSQLLEQGYKGALDAEGMRLLGVVRQNTRRMNALIEDLLAFSRLGRKSLDMMPLDMRQLVQEALHEVLVDAESRPEIATGPLPSCLGDRALVKQVWINLIGNAVKYSSKSERPRIEIRGREEGGQVVYTVKDNGVGFDMQYYGKLFGVFQRLHGADEFSGTGVGLAIVMRVVTRHGGHAWAESIPGQGAVFNFSLPRRE